MSRHPPFPCYPSRPVFLPPRLISESCFHKIPQSGTLKTKAPNSPLTKVVPHCRFALFAWGLAGVRRLFRVRAALAAPSPSVEAGGRVGGSARRRWPRLSLPGRPRVRVVTNPVKSHWEAEKTPLSTETVENQPKPSNGTRPAPCI